MYGTQILHGTQTLYELRHYVGLYEDFPPINHVYAPQSMPYYTQLGLLLNPAWCKHVLKKHTLNNEKGCLVLASLCNGLTAWSSLPVDVDECAMERNVCTQTCTNTDGSFQCGCDPGYALDANGFTCRGIVADIP